MLAYGKLDRDRMGNGYCGSRLGFEFSGTLPSPEGDRRVMGVARQAIATHVWGLPYLVRPGTPLHIECPGILAKKFAGSALVLGVKIYRIFLIWNELSHRISAEPCCNLWSIIHRLRVALNQVLVACSTALGRASQLEP